ncbi:hypothetical protein OH77DRAFT_1432348 [Trametes cingulata]|nr:hypothetical protein OH77DRAFT_1432348 [Trametes cingulata]
MHGGPVYSASLVEEPRRTGSKLARGTNLAGVPQRQRSRLVRAQASAETSARTTAEPADAPTQALQRPSSGPVRPPDHRRPPGSSAMLDPFLPPSDVSSTGRPSVSDAGGVETSTEAVRCASSDHRTSSATIVQDLTSAHMLASVTTSQDVLEDYWFALGAVSGRYRLEESHYVLQESRTVIPGEEPDSPSSPHLSFAWPLCPSVLCSPCTPPLV